MNLMECTCKGKEGAELMKFKHKELMLCENCYKAMTGCNGHFFAEKHNVFENRSSDMKSLVKEY